MYYPDTESSHMLPYHTFILCGVPALCKCFIEETAEKAAWGRRKQISNFSYHFRGKNKSARKIMLFAVKVSNKGKEKEQEFGHE